MYLCLIKIFVFLKEQKKMSIFKQAVIFDDLFESIWAKRTKQKKKTVYERICTRKKINVNTRI